MAAEERYAVGERIDEFLDSAGKMHRWCPLKPPAKLVVMTVAVLPCFSLLSNAHIRCPNGKLRIQNDSLCKKCGTKAVYSVFYECKSRRITVDILQSFDNGSVFWYYY